MDDKRLDSVSLRYIGKPCAHGHSGLRYTSTNACVECVAEYGKRKREITDRARAERGVSGTIHNRSQDRLARSAARGRSDAQYDGRRCKRCGTGRRYTNRGVCVECTSRANADLYAKKTASGTKLETVSDFDELIG